MNGIFYREGVNERVRAPSVAGIFYPADPADLQQMIQGFFGLAEAASGPPPKAIIVPHAGYMYSGPIAANAYVRVASKKIERVVLLGPAHRVFFEGIAAPESLIWETPVGDVPVDFNSRVTLSTFPRVLFSERVHQEEHSLEVQLPFLQELFEEFELVPLAVGEATAEEVSGVLNALWGGPETLIVISSDLSHYQLYEQAVEKDTATADAIKNLNVTGLDSDCACGLTPIAGLIDQARQRDLHVELLDLRNSGDTAGPRDQVVGYGAFAFYDKATDR